MRKYVEDGVVSNGEVVVVESFEVDLRLSLGHQIPHSHFDVLGIVNFEVGHFHGGDLPVEPVEDRHCDCLLTLSPEVKIGEGEKPGSRGCLGEEVEVRSEGDE